MSKIPDHIRLSQMIIPGTHDTLSRFGGGLVQNHSWALSEQMNAGLRYLDVRCRHFRDDFYIHHDTCYQNTMLKNVLADTK